MSIRHFHSLFKMLLLCKFQLELSEFSMRFNQNVFFPFFIAASSNLASIYLLKVFIIALSSVYNVCFVLSVFDNLCVVDAATVVVAVVRDL